MGSLVEIITLGIMVAAQKPPYVVSFLDDCNITFRIGL